MHTCRWFTLGPCQRGSGNSFSLSTHSLHYLGPRAPRVCTPRFSEGSWPPNYTYLHYRLYHHNQYHSHFHKCHKCPNMLCQSKFVQISMTHIFTNDCVGLIHICIRANIVTFPPEIRTFFSFSRKKVKFGFVKVSFRKGATPLM